MVPTHSFAVAKFSTLLQQHGAIVLVVILATFLRVWQLDTHGILFGDAAHDLLVAMDSVDQRQLPLLGIASSVPQFKQGPVAIWLAMLAYPLFGTQLLGYFLLFAVINIAALIGLYELGLVHVHKRTALLASVIFAFSPLAIAHARMPYHITPIPVMTVAYLAALMYLWHKKPYSWFIAGLAFAGLFQFELAVLPLLVMIPYVIWRTKQQLTFTNLSLLLGGLTIGLLPQIAHDLTHNFEQLGGFALWTGRWLGSFFVGVQAPNLHKVTTFTQAWLTFGSRIFAVQKWWGSLLLGGTLIGTIWLTKNMYRGKVSPLIEISLISFYVLFVGYFVHGSPSEAYFPPFLILFSLLGAQLMEFITRTSAKSKYLWLVLVAWAAVNSYSTVAANFFVSTTHPFSYGPGRGEQEQILGLIAAHTDQPFTLKTTSEGGQFANYLDNFRLLARGRKMTEAPNSQQVYYIELPNSSLRNYPNSSRYQFTSVEMYQLL